MPSKPWRNALAPPRPAKTPWRESRAAVIVFLAWRLFSQDLWTFAAQYLFPQNNSRLSSQPLPWHHVWWRDGWRQAHVGGHRRPGGGASSSFYLISLRVETTALWFLFAVSNLVDLQVSDWTFSEEAASSSPCWHRPSRRLPFMLDVHLLPDSQPSTLADLHEQTLAFCFFYWLQIYKDNRPVDSPRPVH